MRDWNHNWLNEGFATYYEHIYLKHSLGEERGAFDLLTKKRNYLNGARQRYMRPIVHDRWNWPNQHFDHHAYQKGAAVLAMLRALMGDDPFRRSITHFLKKHAFGSADTHDFQIAIREASGQTLDWFFDQWIYRAGHPVLDVSYTWDAGAVKIKVIQKQKALYALPVPIGVTTADGKKVHSVWVREREETLSLPTASKPLMVHFDEGDVLLKEVTFAKSTEELLYQLTHDNVIGRLEAAAALRQLDADPMVAGALLSAASKDLFWAVRRDALPPRDIAFLRARAVADETSAVRVAALAALNRLKDASLASFFEERFRKEDSYLAQAEAVRALGKLGASEALLREAEAMKSPNDVIGNAAREALKR